MNSAIIIPLAKKESMTQIAAKDNIIIQIIRAAIAITLCIWKIYSYHTRAEDGME